MKNHVKRISAPKTWSILRKKNKFIKRPTPGSHNFLLGTSMITFLTEIVKIAQTKKEAVSILNNQEVFVNGKRIKRKDFLIGFFDVFSIPSQKYYKLVTLNEKGILVTTDLDEKKSQHRILKLVGKKPLKGKTQLNFLDGTNILIEKNNYKIGDSLILNLKNKKIEKILPLKENSNIILFSGNRLGTTGKIIKIKDKEILVENKTQKFETKKACAFVIE